MKMTLYKGTDGQARKDLKANWEASKRSREALKNAIKEYIDKCRNEQTQKPKEAYIANVAYLNGMINAYTDVLGLLED